MKRNIFGMMLAMFCVLAIVPAVFAQTTIRLFDPVAIQPSPGDNFVRKEYIFGTTQVYLACPVNPTGTLSGPNGGDLIVDDQLLVNGTNVCPKVLNDDGVLVDGGCISGTVGGDPLAFRGQPAQNGYLPVNPIDISNQLTAGANLYTFNLLDFVYSYGSSEINLTTTCTVFNRTAEGFPVCHSNNGKKGQKTIYVDSLEDVNAHLNHHDGRDYVGPCTVGN